MTVSAIVDLTADVLPHLNMIGVETSGVLAELQGFIDAATPIIEDVVGHVIPASFVETYDGGNVSIRLRQLPVLSIESITEVIGWTAYSLTLQPVGSSVDAYGYSLEDPDMGAVTRRSYGGMAYPFYANRGNVIVAYTAGRASVPANVRIGELELIRHWWQYGQQAAGKVSSYAPGSQAEDDQSYSSTPSGYLIPNRVKTALEPSQRPLVIA